MDEALLRRGLAFVHPLWMVTSLAMAVATARLGLVIRNRRRGGRPVGGALRRRHLRLGKASLLLVGVGFAMGPLSMIFLRDRPGFESFHGILGIVTLGLFAWTGWSGRALERGDAEAREIHRIAAAASLGSAFLAGVVGFVLLP